MKTRGCSWLVGLSFLLLTGGYTAFSCPVCFGALDDPATNGLNIAIFTLLGVTGTVLAGFVTFFLKIRKLSRASATEKVDA